MLTIALFGSQEQVDNFFTAWGKHVFDRRLLFRINPPVFADKDLEFVLDESMNWTATLSGLQAQIAYLQHQRTDMHVTALMHVQSAIARALTFAKEGYPKSDPHTEEFLKSLSLKNRFTTCWFCESHVEEKHPCGYVSITGSYCDLAALSKALVDSWSECAVPGLTLDCSGLQDWVFLPGVVVIYPQISIRWAPIADADKSTVLQKIANYINRAVTAVK